MSDGGEEAAAPQGLDEKLAFRPTHSTGNAMCKLSHLLKRWGLENRHDIDPKKPPQLIMVTSVERREFWRMFGPPNKRDTMYEMFETEKLKP